MRNRQLIRQWAILRAMAASSRGVHFRELAFEHAVSVRTVRRDVDALQQAGFPVVERVADDFGRVRWHLLGSLFAETAPTNAGAGA